MNINKLIEKKTVDFNLEDAISKYKNSNSKNEERILHFIDNVKYEVNKEYEVTIASINMSNKRNVLNVFDMASIIGLKEVLTGYIIDNQFEQFKNKYDYPNDFNENDLDFIFDMYSLMVKNTTKAYTELRSEARKLIVDAINSNDKEI